ncbi:FMN-binding negative transcriptional regulator [Mucilaginibacter glaciei]|uniref:FMN-binding negative transcriptional regulator n=1 Tax=Mucilaginibacter glaciei TaxID=2772109 RepID=A0A926S1J1_9SPHI|nr:FMN-binding negative transcriptional regulator [Mucilaginibacter glaciei]MBD1392184.1 FMN-binding negative transcriptional regulator [Mucilaginibacter glaciei]
MYTPKYNQLTDHQQAVDFMRKYSFATIVTVANGLPTATHLPFVVEQRDDQIVLISHFAKANHQAVEIFECTPLVIFTEPHAYISPTHYEKEQNVPTWNYIAVHAYGKATRVDNAAQVLEKTIDFYEAAYLTQWNSLPQEYKTKMMNGIVAFEIMVDDFQGKSKLSQNRSSIERENIVTAFAASNDRNERDIAAYMQKLKVD